jgi:hypothetical protein
VTSSTTIKAIACKSGLTDSSVASAIYTIETLSQVSTPTFSPSGGTFSSAQSVTVSTATTGASIYYTIDSSTPTCSTGTAYSGAINVAVTTTIKAIACKSGMTDSDLASAIYTISQITTQKVADTGQTTSYTTTFGEDHDYVNIPNARSFTGPTQHIIYITDYTTTDNVTGLIWTSCSIGQSGATCTGSATTHTWSDAQIQCAGLNSVNGSAGYAGRTGWRLPIIEELQTLLNYGTYNPAIDTTYFPNTVSDKYWSATTSANSTTYAWNVNFNDGYANGYNKTYSSYVRCVCTGP